MRRVLGVLTLWAVAGPLYSEMSAIQIGEHGSGLLTHAREKAHG